MKYAVIHCGSNNIGRNRPREISDSLLDIGETFLDARPNAYIFTHGIIPRDMSPFSSRRARIREVNMLVRSECNLRDRFVYIEPASEFYGPGGYLNEELYWGDNLHLVEAGNEVMARSISEAVRRKQRNTGVGMMGRPNHVLDSYALGQFESIRASPSNPIPPTSSPLGMGSLLFCHL